MAKDNKFFKVIEYGHEDFKNKVLMVGKDRSAALLVNIGETQVQENNSMIEYEAQDIFDKQWYPAHVLTDKVVNGKIKIEWTSTGFISWVEPERLRIAQKQKEGGE